MKNKGSGGLVYSTDMGRMCPACRRPLGLCSCIRAGELPAASGGAVRVWRETKGRGGKAVTVVRGLALNALELARLSQQLKAACGSGGTVKDGTIEVQGDHCDRVVDLLKAQGHAAKRAAA